MHHRVSISLKLELQCFSSTNNQPQAKDMTTAFTSIGHDSNIFNVSELLAIVNAADFS